MDSLHASRVTWPASRDSCLDLFSTAATRWALPFLPGQTVLEIGCAEADWAALALEAVPSLHIIGVDVRPSPHFRHPLRIVGNILDQQFAENSLDWVVLVSALEHIGLTHYGDPEAPDGDSACLRLVHQWLRPGGWLYFDVPHRRDGYRVEGTSHRIYDPTSLLERLGSTAPWEVIHTAYVRPSQHGEDRTFEANPTSPPDYRPAWFEEVVCVWRKSAHATE